MQSVSRSDLHDHHFSNRISHVSVLESSMPILGLFNHYVIFLLLFDQKQIYTESLAILYISHYPTCLAFLSLVSSILSKLHCLSTPISPSLTLCVLSLCINFSVGWSLHSSYWKSICWPWICLKYSFSVFCFPKINLYVWFVVKLLFQ